ncbi:formylglycine-generating enzyme family protein [Myxococcota bacterium]|nr:formylglycine-generating enzyme family protein [Myxococcota bacterium]MBU1411185.1 formylglycine-generating enzyme family protein [Myxococcota bacterium]MBU1509858.1 formylglycine-generating enzyme family protein [Myxococcota bacterium]
MIATTCTELGYYDQQGILSCQSDCTFDLSVCTGGRCGDGIIQTGGGEDCDGANLAGLTCQGLSLGGGTLGCMDTCRWDTSRCEISAVCGDGTVAAPYEKCELTDLQGETCVTQGFYGGELLCATDCRGFDLNGCMAEGRCGDESIQGAFGEICDGTELGEETCEDLGYHGGLLACGDTCTAWDVSACAEVGRCGDGMIQAMYGEMCDGADLDDQTCGTNGFLSGTLSCDGTCGFDLSGCSMNLEDPNIGTLILVPAGTFQRDATVTNLSTVSTFRMSRHEITRAQWTAVTGWADPSYIPYSTGTNDPVQKVSWYDAIAFCNKLSLLEGLTPVYEVSGVDFSTLTYDQIPADDDAVWNAVTANWAANGYRLPTEMEWMWAAMGADTAHPGAVNTTGYAKAFAGSTGSNNIDDYVWYSANSLDSTHPVGMKLPNELGFHDLSGNVAEKVWDWEGTYPAGSLTDYRGPGSGTDVRVQGGYFFGQASSCTVANVFISNPSSRGFTGGFRVVRP